MSEATPKAPADPVPGKPSAKPDREKKKTASAPRRPGSGPAVALSLLALLVGGAGAGGAYYLWQELDHFRARDAASEAEQRDALAALLTSADSAEAKLKRRIDELDRALQETRSDVGARQETLAQSLAELRGRLGQDRFDWGIAEVEHLLRIANQRLHFANDVQGALAALSAADRRLAALADPAYTPVREALATEIQALRNTGADQRREAALQLTGLIGTADDLPLAAQYRATDRTPPTAKPAAADGSDVTDVRSFFTALWQDIRGLVSIRHREADEAQGPLLAPKERFFLHQNFRLKLESARLALLRGDGELYRSALQEAVQWLQRYFAEGLPATEAARESLARLQQVTVAREFPDIGGSLRQLRTIARRQRQGSGDAGAGS